MEENELNSIKISFMTPTSDPNSLNLSSNPLFSFIITLYILLLLYLPRSLTLSLSPVLLLTSLLLLSLLRLGASQRTQNPNFNTEPQENTEIVEINDKDPNFDDKAESFSLLKIRLSDWVARYDANPEFEPSFVEWDVKAPLEVIYEAYEGEGEEEEDPIGKCSDPDHPTRINGSERYPSSSMYYPETDTDSDCSSESGMWVNGEWDSPESLRFKWEEEDSEGLLIEIALDTNKKKVPDPDLDPISGLDMDSSFQEDNLIEIDIFRQDTTTCKTEVGCC